MIKLIQTEYFKKIKIITYPVIGLLFSLSIHSGHAGPITDPVCWIADLIEKLNNDSVADDFKQLMIKEEVDGIWNSYAVLYGVYYHPEARLTKNILTDVELLKNIHKELTRYPDKTPQQLIDDIIKEQRWKQWESISWKFLDELAANDGWDQALKQEFKNTIHKIQGIKADKAMALLWEELKTDFPNLSDKPYVLQLPEYHHHDFIKNIKSSKKLAKKIAEDQIYKDIWTIIAKAAVANEKGIPERVILNSKSEYDQIKKYISDHKLSPDNYDLVVTDIVKAENWDLWEGKGEVTIEGKAYQINYVDQKKYYVNSSIGASTTEVITITYLKKTGGEFKEYLSFRVIPDPHSSLDITVGGDFYKEVTHVGISIYKKVRNRFKTRNINKIQFSGKEGREKLEELASKWVNKREYTHTYYSNQTEFLVYAKSYTRYDLKTIAETKKYTESDLQKFEKDLDNTSFLKQVNDNTELIIPYRTFCQVENLPGFIRRGENGELEYLSNYMKEHPEVSEEQLIKNINSKKSFEHWRRSVENIPDKTEITKTIEGQTYTIRLYADHNEMYSIHKENRIEYSFITPEGELYKHTDVIVDKGVFKNASSYGFTKDKETSRLYKAVLKDAYTKLNKNHTITTIRETLEYPDVEFMILQEKLQNGSPPQQAALSIEIGKVAEELGYDHVEINQQEAQDIKKGTREYIEFSFVKKETIATDFIDTLQLSLKEVYKSMDKELQIRFEQQYTRDKQFKDLMDNNPAYIKGWKEYITKHPDKPFCIPDN
ncbi:hypothetical protein [Aquimarina megaterium]|uniref:hypothetical protein n=1 Tax=Aquimarina megaterium TaxID=1443666 RepID=UPI0009452F39|nr:hypothetical protein [Aquimarina megaterium]